MDFNKNTLIIAQRREKILNISSFLRKSSNLFCALEAYNANLEQEFFNQFLHLINRYPEIINDDTICPIFIIAVGLWSSYYKRERNYLRFTKEVRNYKFARLFLHKCLIHSLSWNIDPNIKQNHIHGSTAMHWIIAWDRSYEGAELIKLIRQIQGAWNPNVTDASNRAAIALLVARKYFGRKKQAENEDNLLLDELIACLPNLSIQDNLGNTALHYAYIKRDKYFTEKIKQKYNLEELLRIKNNFGQTPYDTLSIKYECSVKCIKEVYNASTPEHIFNKKRWDHFTLV